jgi:hypothetical protein
VEAVLSLTAALAVADPEAVLARVLMEPQTSAAAAVLDTQQHSLVLRVETAGMEL